MNPMPIEHSVIPSPPPALSGAEGRRVRNPQLFILLAAFSFLASPATHATVHYTVSVAHPEEHLFRVTMTVPHAAHELRAQLPAWNARYQVLDFAQYVQNVRARDDKTALLRVMKLDKQTWKITPAGPGPARRMGTVTLQYEIFWDEPGPFTAQLSRDHAFLNFAMVLLYVPDRRNEEVSVEFSDVPEGWAIAAALPPGESHRAFRAASYDALLDAPVEMGTFAEFRVEAGKARLRVVVHGDGWDRETLGDVVRRIAAYQTEMMRDVPFDEYLFIYHFGEGGGGGMEHANSTAIHLGSGSNPAGVTAHEFFHLWNVKRIRPQSLEPVDHTREMWTRALWFAEGVTSTYGAYTLVRTGLNTPEQFYRGLAQEINALESRLARKWKSVEEASLDAWLEKYPSFRRPSASISYYNKGQILGVLLDILLREATSNRASLDDVFRYLNETLAKNGRFYDDSAGIRAAVAAVAARAGAAKESHARFEEFFARYVAGTDDLPYSDILAHAGLRLVGREEPRASLGFSVGRARDGAAAVASLVPGGGADRAGLREGDVLLSLDKGSFPSNPDRWLRDRRPGRSVSLRFRRGTNEEEISFPLGQEQSSVFSIEEEKRPSELALRIRDGLLKGKTD